MTPAHDKGSVPASSVCLVVLDGWGLAEAGAGNAVSLADTPVFDALWSGYPHTELTACGRAVGLPDGQMGNSEVGHLTLGSGAILTQDLLRIDDAVAAGHLGENTALRDALTASERVHLIGLVSDGGVHSGWSHLHGLIELAGELGVRDLVLHCFTDGRDTLPTAGAGYLAQVQSWCAQAGVGRIVDVIGRYYAMDRDNRWERVQLAYDMLVHGRAEHSAADGPRALRDAYERGETDEFVRPTLVGAEGRIRPQDSVLCFNFRPDRVRELTRALAEPDFDAYAERLPGWVGRGGGQPVARYATMTEYEEGWPYPVAFAPQRPSVTLASFLAGAGVSQLHVAETEKYPHVTYFFNGGEEAPVAGERRVLVPSPRDVPTYDHKPEMSAPEVTAEFVAAWDATPQRFAIVNFANADMVGHTGVIPAAVRAVEAVDSCLGEIVDTVHRSGGVCVVTADHGNADHMLEPDGSPNTAHSLNPVPLIVTVPDLTLAAGGALADVAPTVLALLGLEPPPEMTGHSLITAGGS